MPETTVDVGALYGALDGRRRGEGITWRELARQLEVSPSTFSRMAQGRRPDVDTFATFVHWLGMPADRFMRSSAAAEEEPEPIAMISAYLRSARNIRPEDAEALQDIMQAAYRRLAKDK